MGKGGIWRDGLQEPLLVYKTEEGRFAIIDGVRRPSAVQEMGWDRVACIIKEELQQADAAHLSYVKNVERTGFNAIEIATHLKTMMDEFGFSRRDLELKGYGSVAHISNTIRLLELPDKVQAQIVKGELSAAHGLQLLRLNTQKEREQMAKRIIDNELPVSKTEFQIEQYLLKGHKQQEKRKTTVPESEIPGVYIKDSRDMSELPDKSVVHLIVSSPPYFIGKEYEVGMTFDEHIEMVKGVLKECGRVLVDGGVVALNVGDIHRFKGRKGKNKEPEYHFMGNFYQAELKKHQIRLSDHIIWRKPLRWRINQGLTFDENTNHCSYRIFQNWEPVYIFRKAGERENVGEELELRSRLSKDQWINLIQGVWDIMPVKNFERHPTPFPDELPRRLIQMFSYEGDTVLDPWLGSGTTVKVAREMNREGIGYEKEEKYKEVIMWKLGMEVAGEAVEAFRSQLDDILGDTAQKESVAEMENVPSEVVSENSPVLVAASEASASELPSL
ncbi:MAG: DNA methyltransferase [Desulfobacteraceae bacterium]